MNKVVIVSYIFPPNTTVVSSFRPYSWYLEFEKHGLFPIVVTRHWTTEPIMDSLQLGNEIDLPVKEVINGNKKIFYLPYKNNFYEKQLRKSSSKIFPKLWELAGLLSGNFTREADLYHSFYDEISKIVQREKPKVLLLTALPLSAVKLGYYLKKKFGLPVIIDFRDYWNNNLLNDNFKFSWRAKFSFKIQEKFIQKWLRDIDAVVSVSQPILDKLSSFTGAKNILIHNGFEKNLFDDIVPTARRKFTVSLIGILYPTQHIDFVIKGFKEFLKLVEKPEECSLEFIGQDFIPEVSKLIKAHLPEQNVITTPRIPRREALSLMKSSHVLFYSGWKGWKGIYSGKIFEYLAAKRNILIAPGDDDVIDELILKTRSGKIANTIEEFAQILLKWYIEWRNGNELTYMGINDEIAKYSREALAEELASHINDIIHKS